MIWTDSNCFHCSAGCGTLTAKQLAERLGVDWISVRARSGQSFSTEIPLRSEPRTRSAPSGFASRDAKAIWRISSSWVRNDNLVRKFSEAYDYLASRNLTHGWDLDAFGLTPSGIGLATLDAWAKRGYLVIAPLYDGAGELVNIQARCVRPAHPKTLVPSGSRVSETVFANRAGLALLRGECANVNRVILGEGLTDSIALSFLTDVPALTSPGCGSAAKSIGPWVKGRDLLLALDNDAAGERSIRPIAKEAYAHGATSVWRMHWPRGMKDICDVLSVLGPEEASATLERVSEVPK